MKREIVKKTMMLLAISGMIFSGCGKEEKEPVNICSTKEN